MKLTSAFVFGKYNFHDIYQVDRWSTRGFWTADQHTVPSYQNIGRCPSSSCPDNKNQ